ncbi:MAG: hypothetical protein AABZ65_05435 [Candidatus Omnitrophota bacterium]
MKIKEILNSPNFIKMAVIILLMLIADALLIVSIKSLWAKNSGLAREVKDRTSMLEKTTGKSDPEGSLTEEVRKLRLELSSIEGRFFSDGGDILAYLNQFTRDSQIKFKGIYPSESAPLEIPGVTAEKDPKQTQKGQKAQKKSEAAPKKETKAKKEAKGKKTAQPQTPQKPKTWESPAINQLPVKITMECGYQQLLQFLDTAENGPKLIMVSDIKIETNPQDIWSQNVELSLKIPTIPATKKTK